MTLCSICGKGDRATLYCRRGDCPGLAGSRASAVLPPPKIDVIHDAEGEHTVDVVVSRPGTGDARSYRGQGQGVGEAVKQVIEKIFADPGSREYHG